MSDHIVPVYLGAYPAPGTTQYPSSFIFTSTYNPNNATTIQKTINKQRYNYYLNPNFVLFKMERFTKNKLSGQIELQNDSAFVMTNTKNNIHYKMSFIENQN
jgi:hypothetical protein